MAIRYINAGDASSRRKPANHDRAITPAIKQDSQPVGPKIPISIRLDQDVIAALKSEGPGWQSRANALLRSVLGL